MITAQTRAGTQSAALRRGRRSPSSMAMTGLTYLVALLFFFPILWTVLTGFKTEGNAVAQPPSLFFQPTLENYRAALFGTHYLDFFLNSLILSLGLYPTRRTPNVLSWVLSTKMLPVVGVLIPLIVIYKQVGLFDSRAGMILLYAAMNLPLVIWMMRSFFAEFPREIIEASQVDGAGFLRALASVVLPLVTPGLAATALLCLIFAWNEFFLAVNLTGPNSGPLSVYISSFMTSEGLFWAKMSAASTVAIAPVFIAGWPAQ